MWLHYWQSGRIRNRISVTCNKDHIGYRILIIGRQIRIKVLSCFFSLIEATRFINEGFLSSILPEFICSNQL